MPVLYGVFLYMGVASLSGIQVRCVSAVDVIFLNKLSYCGWTSHLLHS